jgi:indole-3-glycerol phosphate synthase
MAFLDQILERKQAELAEAKRARSLNDIKGMLRDAPAVNSFGSALVPGFGMVAEIKKKSPSGGEMLPANVAAAPAAYARSRTVRAVSVLTNKIDFGMGIEELSRVKAAVAKPVLRKDFIFEEYQVYEARAFGADALLLMANVLDRDKLKRLFELSSELQMDVLFEAHTREEIESIPEGAKLYGINSRKFKATGRWQLNKLLLALGTGRSSAGPDLSLDSDVFSLVQYIPPHGIKIAESGLEPAGVSAVMRMGYDVALVGTSLLKAPGGIDEMLADFEDAIAAGGRESSDTVPP